MYDICSAILAINPSAQVSIIEEDFDRMTWLNGTTPISKSDIQAKQAEIKADYDSKQYQRERREEYPSIEEQLDIIFWDKKNGTTEWEDSIQVIKNKYPK